MLLNCLLMMMLHFHISAQRIVFNVVHDNNGYDDEYMEIINLLMETPSLQKYQVPYIVKEINPNVPLQNQIEAVCCSPASFEVVLSATSCDQLMGLARQSAAMGVLHLAVNVDGCGAVGLGVLLDRETGYDVAKAVEDVVQQWHADVVVVHDEKYEMASTVHSLLHALTEKRIRYSYFKSDHNVDRLAKRLDIVRRGAKNLTVVVLADFSETKAILDKMYLGRRLDSNVVYMIVNDGWELVNPEIEEPQPVNYDMDINMLLLKRKLRDDFSQVLTDFVSNNNSDDHSKFSKWRVHMGREDVFVCAALWSAAKIARMIWNNKKDTTFNSSFPLEADYFNQLVKASMFEAGTLSASLYYVLLRNIPVESNSEIFRSIGHWRAEVASPRFRYFSPTIELQLLFHNRTLKLGMPINPPYTIPDIQDEANSGAVVKLFDYLKKRLKFKYEVFSPEDNEWGVKLKDGTWSGAIGMLLNRTIDIVPFLGITTGRSRVVDFSEPVLTTSTAILVQKPKEPPRTYIFLRPFAPQVWILILLMIPVMSFVLQLIYKKSLKYVYGKHRKKGGLTVFPNCFWYMYGALLQQGGVYLPETVSARIVICFWWLFVMVVMATYSGNLIAFLTFPEADWKVSSIEDLASKLSITVIIQEGTSIHQEIEESPVETYVLLKRRFSLNQNALLLSNVSEIVPLVKRGSAAFVEDLYVLSDLVKSEHARTGKCELALVPRTALEIYMGIATRKGSPYLKDMDALIRRLWHGGLMQFWAKQFTQLGSLECHFVTTTLRGGRKDVTLNDLQGAFWLLVCGTGLAAAAMVVEAVTRPRHRRLGRRLMRNLVFVGAVFGVAKKGEKKKKRVYRHSRPTRF